MALAVFVITNLFTPVFNAELYSCLELTTVYSLMSSISSYSECKVLSLKKKTTVLV